MIESKSLSYNPQFRHHSSGRALRSAAQDGCPLCLRIWRCFSPDQRYLLAGADISGLDYEFSEREAPDSLRGTPVTGRVQRFVKDGCYRFDFRCNGVKWHFVTNPSTDASCAGERISSWQEHSTSAEQVMLQAESWLQTCLEQHDCSKGSQSEGTLEQWRPTRLINVGTSGKAVLRLVSTRNVHITGSYMTLSHCWGSRTIFTLQRSNLTRLHSSIPWEELTLSFRNAITVTRRLGIQYLWIDSLCIIQDSSTDWLHEGSLMGKVYKHSYCNIAATCAIDGGHGLFVTRDPNVVKPLQVRFPKEVQEKKTVLPVLNRVQRAQLKWTFAEWHDIVDADLWSNAIDKAPLNQRAWVAQEVGIAFLSSCQIVPSSCNGL